MDAVLIALPGLLLTSISALPLALGTLAAVRHMRAGHRSGYFRNLNGSIAAGFVVLLLLAGSLFSDDLPGSSTAGLIFVFAPIYAAGAQGIVFAISAAAMKASASSEPISVPARRALLLPLSMLALLVAGLLNSSIEGNDLAVAERATNPETLQRLFERSRSGEADSFSVPLFLTQNPNTSAAILTELGKHEHPAIRAHVVQHPNTPLEVVASLSNDCASFTREAAQKRLGTNKALQPTQPPSGGCAAER